MFLLYNYIYFIEVVKTQKSLYTEILLPYLCQITSANAVEEGRQEITYTYLWTPHVSPCSKSLITACVTFETHTRATSDTPDILFVRIQSLSDFSSFFLI